jgi:sugar phosphate isomerase/epimerase
MIQLSAFADEISSDLSEQIKVLQQEHIHFIDLRSAWGVNVLDLTDAQVEQAHSLLHAAGIGVAAIGSPLGKVPIDSPAEESYRRLDRAITVAKALHSNYIRIFSFYAPADTSRGTDPASYRDEVLNRLRKMVEQAKAANIVLVHENEKEIYGDTVARNVDLLQNINDPHFTSALDPANYLQCDQIPYPDAYVQTKPWLGYVHVKDVRSNGTLAVAGEGEARWPELLERLRQDGYDGFMALEPHLAAAGQYQGFSGPDLFRKASQALQKLLQAMNWSYQ